jgi:hypothetical protein
MALSKQLLGLAAVCLAVGTAHAVELPIRKPGLWDMKMLPSGQMPGMTMQHCTDAATDKRMSDAFMPMAKNVCSKTETQKTANGYVTNSVCTVAGVTATTRADVVGDFNSAYTVKTTSQAPNAPKGAPRDSNITIEAKWLGACAAGQKPGDIMMPGGLKMNVKDLEKVKSLLPK